MESEPDIELTREMARLEVQRSSLRLVASEIGISHVALRDFIADGSKRQPYGAGRRKLLEWSARREKFEPLEKGRDYYQGMQDALSGIIEYVDKRREEIRDYYEMVRLERDLDEGRARRIAADSRETRAKSSASNEDPPSPSIEQAAAEAEVLRRLPALPPLETKKGKRRA